VKTVAKSKNNIAANEIRPANPTPKLLFVGDPGALVSPAFAESFAKGLRNCKLIHVGRGLHYLQEDHPQEIGAAIREWLTELELRAAA
jgi:haloalkane dehalogenase